MRTVKAAGLILDFDLYPRNNVDAHNVRAIADAEAAGAKTPPVVVERKSQRVVDGFHRVKARLSRDPEATIEVIEKTYKNDAELFLDAVRYNAQHGARLDQCDRTRCALLAERLSIPVEAMAGALKMPVDKLAGLRADRTATTAGGLSIPLKRTIRHMHGRRLSKPQVEANEKLGGMNAGFYVNQLCLLLENNLIDKEDEKLFARLERLRELLEGILQTA